MSFKLRSTLAFASLILSSTLLADKIVVTGGSVITGKIKQINKEKMIVSTDFSDDIVLSMDKVLEYKTDDEVKVRLTDGQVITGQLDSSNSGVLLKGKSTETKAGAKSVVMLWDPEENAPDYVEPIERKWKYKVGASWVKKTGNTDEEDLGINFNATLEDEKDTLMFYGRYNNNKTDGESTENERIVGVDYEIRFKERSSWYVRGEAEDDEFEGIDLRLTLATGYGYYFKNEEHNKLRGRLGVFYRNESYNSDKDDESTYGLDLGLRFDYQLPNNFAWYTDVTYTPSVESIDEYRITHESALVLPIGETDWSLKFGIRNEYNSEAPDDKDELDNTYFSILEVNF